MIDQDLVEVDELLEQLVDKFILVKQKAGEMSQEELVRQFAEEVEKKNIFIEMMAEHLFIYEQNKNMMPDSCWQQELLRAFKAAGGVFNNVCKDQ